MSVGSLEKPELWVEGRDDLHTILHLLGRHAIVLDDRKGPVVLKEGKGDRGVLDAMATTAKAHSNRPVGFVLDADDSLQNRWSAARNKLKDLKLDLPDRPPAGGYAEDSSDGVYRVGVWIMPDNAMGAGAIERLIETLVPPGDALFQYAKEATAQAINRGAKPTGRNVDKAELHCWLAWQEKPGLPFGSAIKAKFFGHDSDAALAFVAWFKTLYKGFLPPTAS